MKNEEMTKEWQKYYEELAAHELLCEYTQNAFKKVDYLIKDRVDKGTASWINQLLNNELLRMKSMDAPNKPGYFRANND